MDTRQELEKYGLYDPRFEHDACGVGFVGNIKGLRSPGIVKQGLEILKRLSHRGATGADPKTGDGAGILIQTPHAFFRRIAQKNRIELPAEAEYGTGLVFLPTNKAEREFCQKVFFQNHDDLNEFVNQKLLTKDKTAIINGSGVNLEKFTPQPLPDKPGFIFIGRLIRDKGVSEFLQACRLVKKEYPDINCILLGPFDSNPSALKKNELQRYTDAGVIEYAGEQSDVRPYLKRCTTLVLPSYHEGTPKSVLEAMSMGRAVITTNAPGCRDVVTNGVNGYLVDVKDIEGLAGKMKHLINNPGIIPKMGKAGLETVQFKYDVRIVNKSILMEMGFK